MREGIGLAVFCGLMIASGALWVLIFHRWRTGREVVPVGPARRWVWSRGMAFAALMMVAMQWLSLANAGAPRGEKAEKKEYGIRDVQEACAHQLFLAAILVGAAALSAVEGEPLDVRERGSTDASPLNRPLAISREGRGEGTELPAVPRIDGEEELPDEDLVPIRWGGPASVLFAECTREDLKFGVLGFAACWLPVYAVNELVAPWRAAQGKHVFLLLIEKDPRLVVVALVAFSVVVIAPLTEELLYRVGFQGWLERVMPSWLAITIVAALFAGAHYSPGRPDFVPLFPLALILGYVYHRRRSLGAVMLLHALFNAANLLLAWWEQ